MEEASFLGQQQLDAYVTDSPPAPTTKSPTSSLIVDHVHDGAADMGHPMNGHASIPQKPPPPPPPPAGGVLDKISHWTNQRSKRKVRYPTPFDRFFDQLDLWKLLAVIGAMVTSIATFGKYKLISDECVRALILMLCFSLLFLMVAYTLQDMVPEIAVGATLAGIALVIASFHTVGLHLLDLREETRYLALCVLLVGYLVLFALTLQKIVKDDVREKEEVEETKALVAN